MMSTQQEKAFKVTTIMLWRIAHLLEDCTWIGGSLCVRACTPGTSITPRPGACSLADCTV